MFSVPLWFVFPILHQAFQQKLQLAHFGFHGEGSIGQVLDGYAQQSIVILSLELVDDAAIFNLALADANLEFARRPAGIGSASSPTSMSRRRS